MSKGIEIVATYSRGARGTYPASLCTPSLAADHPMVGMTCPACMAPFLAGDAIALVALGPGGDAGKQALWEAGKQIAAPSVPVHAACGGVHVPEGASVEPGDPRPFFLRKGEP